MLTEDDVVDAVCRQLERDGWGIESRALAVQHGDDIVAVKAGCRLIVEAKGEGSSKPGTRRFGQTFTRNQVKSHVAVAVAVLRALSVVSRGDARAAVAFPDNQHHREVAGAAAPALARADVGLFWVADDGRVSADVPWPM